MARRRPSEVLRRYVPAIALVLVATSALPAAAQRRPADPEAARRDKEAREHYNQGILHYDLGEIDVAVVEFKKAYAISAAPGLLFNIAQAYRFKKDYEQALYFYQTYLRLAPRAVNRADVETRIAELEELVKQGQRMQKEKPHGIIPPGDKSPDEQHAAPQPASGSGPGPASTPREATESTAPPAPATGATLATASPPTTRAKPFLRTSRGIGAIAVGSVGVAALVTAAALGSLALARKNDYNRSCDTGLCDQSQYDRAHGFAIGTDVLIAVGAAAVVTSVVLILTRPKASTRAAVTPAPGGGVPLRVSF